MGIQEFGPGVLYLTRTDVANSTPVNIGFANEFSFDVKGNIKELFGQNQYPLAVAVGTKKVTLKVKAAQISGLALNSVFFGDTFATGGIIWNYSEAHAVPGTPYTVTVTNSATFEADLGVLYATTGLPLTKVPSGATIGQYSVAAGVYTFAAADTLANVLITYTSTTTAGQSLAVNNHLLGFSPFVQLDYYTSFQSKPLVLRFYQVIGDSLAMAAKLEDFIMPELDMAAFANAAGNVIKMVWPEVD
jgi:hypothetical protein